MAHIEVNALSVNLSGTFGAHIFFPEVQLFKKKRTFSVVWMIHEDSGSPFDLLRYTSVLERAAKEKEIFIISPTVSHSLCTDMVWGTKNEIFLAKECMEIFRFLYPLRSEKEDNYVLGIGTGAYGACKLAMHFPQTFGTCIAVNGELDITVKCEAPENKMVGFPFQSKASLEAIFGDLEKVRGSRHDLYAIAPQVDTRLYLFCSTGARGYQDNVRLAALGRNVTTEFSNDGTNGESALMILKEVLAHIDFKQNADIN